MIKRMIFPALLGLVGVAVLMSLGFWQLNRLAWKEAILAEREAKIHAAPAALPTVPDPVRDAYLPVSVTGRFTGEVLQVLVSRKQIGAGVRGVEVFETDGRRILIDRGFVLDANKAGPFGADATNVTGNLHWPVEVDGFTPPPDPKTGLWFARDVPAMAAALQAEPVLLIARSATAPAIEPLPVDTSDIPNDHFGYAVQWFGLAAVWLGMTVYLLWRIRRRTV